MITGPLARLPLAVLTCALALLCITSVGRAQQSPVKVLLISDIHFEPFWDPGKASELDNAPASKWPAILDPAHSTPNRAAEFAKLEAECPARGPDTSIPLLLSSLKEIKANAAGAVFATLSGDLVAHRIQCEYQHLLPSGSDDDYAAFIEKTISFVLDRLNNTLTGMPVYAALGNNDSGCGDWQLDGNSKFLAAVGADITQALPQAQRADALSTLSIGGYYGVDLPSPMQNTRLLVLDDLFLAKGYSPCTGKSGDVSDEELKWLHGELQDAKGKLWIMGHVPPGIDPFATLHGVASQCVRYPHRFMTSDALTDLLKKSTDTVSLGIFAHSHMDEIKLMTAGPASAPGAALHAIPIKVVPSISPINGNNPSFTVAEVDPTTATMVNYQVISAKDQAGSSWGSYDYATDYGESSFSADAVADLIAGFASNSPAKAKAMVNYLKHYEAGHQKPFPGNMWQGYVCSMSHNTSQGFVDCACSSK